MIGIIGPQDSVVRVLETAAAEDFGPVIGRVYDAPEQALQTAQESVPLCRVLLFTGEYPYRLTRAEWSNPDTELLYIQHTPADLYRSLARLLVAQPGLAVDCPGLVVDVLGPKIIHTVIEDIGLVTDVTRLDSWDEHNPAIDIDDLAARHAAVHRTRSGLWSLTCFGVVYDKLHSLDIPCARIAHTHSTIIDALRQAKLLDIAVEAREQQPTVILASPRMSTTAEHHIRSSFADHELSRDTERRLTVHTTRLFAQSTLKDLQQVSPRHPIGVGLAVSSHEAYAQALQALSYAETNSQTAAIFENGAPVELFEQISSPNAGSLATTANSLGLAPLVLYRLQAAFRRIDPGQFTVPDLADAYGTSTRTARRLVHRLRELGIAEQAGKSKPPGAGRPSPIYRIDPGRLLTLR